ncbi:MAG: hypothetical protein ACOH1V_07965 [Stenotrophomonas sp.]
METQLSADVSIYRILVFDEVYSTRAAEEQAEKSKLSAFGTLARLNPLNRPKTDTVNLSKSELRYEPFWQVSARRQITYVHEAVYPLPVANPHARQLEIAGQVFEVLTHGGKPRVELAINERCHREIDTALYQDGLKRPIKQAKLQGYVERYRAVEQPQLDLPGAVAPQMPFASVVQVIKSQLAAEAIDAHRIDHDLLEFISANLYFRPVFAFEYLWTGAGRIGVIEIDGLTGEVVEDGQWFRDKLDTVMSREMLFELGAEVASAALPGAGFAVKVLGKLTQERTGHS